MRKGVWKVPAPQDVCIFCASRIQFASVGASSGSQRRLFASTAPARKPPVGATAAQQKENAGDQGWAAWTPPPEVFQSHTRKGPSAPQNSSEVEGRTVGGIPRGPEGHVQARRPNLVRQQESRDRPYPPSLKIRKSPQREPLSLRSDPKGLGDQLRRDETSWQGLRRKSPIAEAQSANSEVPLTSYIRPDTSYRNEERMVRSEASKQDGYVPLEGLQRRKRSPFRGADAPQRNSMQIPDTVVPPQRPPRKQGAEPSPSVTTLSRKVPPSTPQSIGVGKAARSQSDWPRYDPQAVQQTPIGVNPPSLSAYSPMLGPHTQCRPERRVGRDDYNDWANATSYTPAASSAQSERSSSPRTETDSRTEPSSHEPTYTVRYRESRISKPERESEIVVPRAHGRTVGPLTRESNANRRKERKRSTPSSAAEEDLDFDDDELSARRAARRLKMQKAKEREARNTPPTPIHLPEFISVSNLAGVLRIRVEQFLRKTVDLGFEGLTNDHILDAETAGLIASEYNFEPIVDQNEEQDLKAQPPIEDKSIIPARPPIVTIMGHVDHGKTTLLDFLRKSSVAASEHGGITQHIGAFSVPMSGGRLVTFLDTPGHAAFLSMRQRGANVTDIVILVVAADDSVKPQTIEAIKHAQSAKVPMIVAINKMDKEDARPEKVKQDLARYGVEIEDFGGDTQVVCVSGKTGLGMAELEDAAVALADILDMRAPTDGLTEGWVLEATTKKAGRVATVLVRRGTIRPGDVIVAGTSWARVRSLRNEAGVAVDSAGPGTPVLIDGWREQPTAGDEVLQSPANDEQKAKSVVAYRLEASQREQLAKDMTAVNEARRIEQEKREALERAKELAAEATGDYNQSSSAEGTDAATGASKEAGQHTGDAAAKSNEVFFILKADVSGSVEAVASSVLALGSSEIRAHILRSGVGPITEFDIDHAAAAKGHIINFNTTVDGAMARLAEERGVRVLDQSIIYRLIDQVKGVLEERLPQVVTKRVLGEAEIAQVFDINIRGRVRVPVAGCKVRNGEIAKKEKVRVLRGGDVIFEGNMSSLKNVKKDIPEARKGMECGLGFEGWTEFKVGDQVQSYEEKSEPRRL